MVFSNTEVKNIIGISNIFILELTKLIHSLLQENYELKY